MDDRTKKLLEFLEVEITEIFNKRVEMHRKNAAESEVYIEAKSKFYSILDNADDGLREKILEIESLRSEMDSMLHKRVYYELSQDILTLMRLSDHIYNLAKLSQYVNTRQ